MKQPGPYVPCPHGYPKEECEACSPQAPPRVGQPAEPTASERPLSWIWWTLLGGVVGAIGIKLVDRFWPKKPEVVYHVPVEPGETPPQNPQSLPAGQGDQLPPEWWKTGA